MIEIIALRRRMMKIRILGFGVLIGILLCSIAVNAEEYDRKGEESTLAM